MFNITFILLSVIIKMYVRDTILGQWPCHKIYKIHVRVSWRKYTTWLAWLFVLWTQVNVFKNDTTIDLLLYHIHTCWLLRTLTWTLILYVLMHTRLDNKIYKYIISDLVCMKQTYSTTCVHRAGYAFCLCLLYSISSLFVWLVHGHADSMLPHMADPTVKGGVFCTGSSDLCFWENTPY